MYNQGFAVLFGILMFAWLIPTVAIGIYRDHMRAMLRKQIRRLRRERLAVLLDRREVRNAARLLRAVAGAGFTGSKEFHP